MSYDFHFYLIIGIIILIVPTAIIISIYIVNKNAKMKAERLSAQNAEEESRRNLALEDFKRSLIVSGFKCEKLLEFNNMMFAVDIRNKNLYFRTSDTQKIYLLR